MHAHASTTGQASPAPAEETIVAGLRDLAWKALWTLAALTALTGVLVAIGNGYGERLVTGGLSTRTDPIQIVIGNDVLDIPQNMIRREEHRIAGVASSVDLKIHWPDKSGFRRDLVGAFADTDPASAPIVIVRLMQRQGLLDMNARFGPVYLKALADRARWHRAAGLTVAPLRADLGFVDEVLAFSGDADRRPAFVARCQGPGAEGEALLLACETDIFVGESLEARRRFPQRFLGDWARFGPELRALLDGLLVTPNG